MRESQTQRRGRRRARSARHERHGGPASRRPWREERGIGLVEVLIALILLSVGLLSVAGISLSVGAQSNWSTWQTDQTLAGQQVLERIHLEGYAAATSGTETITVGNRTYSVTRTVTQVAPRVKEVEVTVSSSRADVRDRTFATRLYENRQLPAAPLP